MVETKASFSYKERRWFANRRRRARGPKQQLPRDPRRRFETRLKRRLNEFGSMTARKDILCS